MRTALLVLVTVAALAAAPPPALAQAGFFDISTGPTGLPANDANDIAVGPDGVLYVAGRFRIGPAGASAQGVARRVGNAWVMLPGGLSGPPRRIAFAPDGSLWALGSFTVNGGALVGVARFDGTAWVSAGATFNGSVENIAIASDGTVVVTGGFTQVNGAAALGIARFLGGAWGPVPGAPGPPFPPAQPALIGIPTAAGADVYVSVVQSRGAFTLERRVARISGGVWTDLGVFPDVLFGASLFLAVSPSGTLYAMNPNGTPGQTAYPVYEWTGSAWTPLANPLPSAPGAFAVGPDGAFYTSRGTMSNQNSSGTAALFRRTGAAWVPFGTFSENTFAISASVRFAFSGTDVYVSGLPNMNGLPVTNIGRYDGAAWHVLGSETDGNVLSLANGPGGSVYASGDFTRAGGALIGALGNGLARWDGAAWSAVGTAPNGQVYAIAPSPDGSVVACGTFTQIGGVAATRVARWNGSAWSALGAGLGTATPGSPGGVAACAAGPGGVVYATGNYGGLDQSLVSRWDGSAWTTLATLTQATRVRAMTVGTDGALYVSGAFMSVGGVAASRVARYSGGAWSALGAGLDETAAVLTVGPSGEIVAGGYFRTAGGAPARYVARWTGTAWQAYGAGLPNSIFALAFGPDGTLYAAGERGFVSLPLQSAAVRWTGREWQDLAPNTIDGAAYANGDLRALVVDARGDLILGGEFTNVGQVRSNGAIRFGRPATVGTEEDPRDGLALAVGPNPSRGTATAFVTGPAGEQTVEVLDALGRRVARTSCFATAGRREVPMPSGLTPGLYVVRVTAGAETRTVRFVVVR